MDCHGEHTNVICCKSAKDSRKFTEGYKMSHWFEYVIFLPAYNRPLRNVQSACVIVIL